MQQLASSSTGRVVTLGQFIIDQFEHLDPKTGAIVDDHHPEQVGGGGTYAIIGARHFLPPSALGMIVDQGSDFPRPMRDTLDRFGHEMWWFRPRKEGERTTRALNIYQGEERGEGFQSFRYLTPRLRLSPLDFPPSPFVTHDGPPAYLHFVCGPERAEAVVSEVKTLGWKGRTGLVWEPMPPDCTPENRPSIAAAAKHMTILSPNHLEALALLGVEPSLDEPGLKGQIEQATSELARWLGNASIPPAEEPATDGSGRTHQQKAAIIRSGPLGVCYALSSSSSHSSSSSPVVRWLPPVFGPEQARVRDVTGGGNAFLGGVCAGLKLEGGDVERAILYGSVAASFAIEQSGLPTLSSPFPLPASDPTSTNGAQEVWNGSETALARLERYERLVARLAPPGE